MISGWWHGGHPLPSDRCGVLLGAQGGVWIPDPAWAFPLVMVYPPLVTGVWNRGLWVFDNDVALLFAQAEEDLSALPGDFDTRPWAMPLQEREEMVVLLAQRGLRFRDVQVRILEFAGLA